MNSTPTGLSLDLYFIDGHPDGMLTAEIFNWTGHVLITPRTQLKKALARKEAGYTGVYILTGEQAGEAYAYIGESEDIGTRIKNHDTKMDWWTTAILVTSAANTLNKAHAKYLEARLIEKAHGAARVKLANGNAPGLPGLSESVQANMESFLHNLLMVLPAVRVDVFISHARPAHKVAATAATPRFELNSKKHGVKATAVQVEEAFEVEAGSTARQNWVGIGTEGSGYAMLHAELRQSGILQPQGEFCVFTKNYVFKSPSAAAAVVLGRNSNGTLEWRVAGSGATYKQWEAQQLQVPGAA
jgi:hypothetical protein